MQLSIVIPAYNEEKRIPYMLDRYCAFFGGKDTEFIVVLNGCHDQTRQIVDRYTGNVPNVRVIEIKEAIGKGAAVKQGFALAKGDYIGFVDADGATEPEEFEKLVDCLKNASSDIAVASRWKRGSRMVGRNTMRKMVSFGFIIFVKLFFWMPILDTQCGAKLLTKKALAAILPKLTITNMAFDVELIYRARQAGMRVTEIPTVWYNRDNSATLGSPLGTIKGGLRMFFTLVRIRLS